MIDVLDAHLRKVHFYEGEHPAHSTAGFNAGGGVALDFSFEQLTFDQITHHSITQQISIPFRANGEKAITYSSIVRIHKLHTIE